MKMKVLQIDTELYDYIARQTQHIGESASVILRRLLKLPLLGEGGMTAAAPQPAPPSTPSGLDRQQELKQLLNSARYRNQSKSISRFMQLLSTLYQLDPSAFAQAAAVTQGRTRRYFATDQHSLQRGGSQTKPQQIPETPYWVITNTNAARKRAILHAMLMTMQFPKPLIEALCDSL